MRDVYEKLPLSKIATIERGKFSARPRNDPRLYGGSTPFLQTGDIARAGSRITVWEQTLNEQGLAVSRLFPSGTLFMSIAANIGDVAISTFEAACPDSVVAITPKNGIDKEWLLQMLKMSKGNLSSLATQNAQANLSLEKIGPFKVPVPSFAEQRAVGTLLRTWDATIETTKTLIDLRRRSYLGIRGKLIDWAFNEQTSLSRILKPVSRPVARPNEPYRALSLRSHGKGSFDRLVENPDSVDMETLYVVRAGDLVVSITFGWEGAIALVPPEHDGCLVSHRFPTFVPLVDRVSERYLRHALRMPRFTYLLGIVSPGGAGRNRVLSKNDFLELQIPLPSLERQTQIAAILDDAEALVAAETRYLDALARQKRGLMQKLLTGQWRVPVKDHAAAVELAGAVA